MNGGKNKGYTVVEVMIFLAVSGAMFVMAAAFISGKQATTQFNQGVNEFNSKIQAVMQDVISGQYATLNNVTCTSSSGVPNPQSGSTNQGTNTPCVFLGKVIHLAVSGSLTKYEVFSIAGSRLTSSNQIATSLSDFNPKAIAKGGLNSLVVQNDMPYSLPISAVKVVAASDAPSPGAISNSVYGFGFLTTATGAASTSGSGAQTVGLYYINNLTNSAFMDTNLAADMINNPSNIIHAASVTICINDGGNRQAAIIIGLNNNQLNATVDKTRAVTC